MLGRALNDAGFSVGVTGETASPDGYGGSFTNYSGGNLLRGVNNTTVEFRVDGNGTVFANGGFQPYGADFAESMGVSGDRAKYAAGDLLVIDSASGRRLALAQTPYSTLVAGIYSTKPGMLGSLHKVDESAAKDEIPLAVVGIVPCKVSAENGAIRPRDAILLYCKVTSTSITPVPFFSDPNALPTTAPSIFPRSVPIGEGTQDPGSTKRNLGHRARHGEMKKNARR
jgi:hypothetical protein